MRSRKRDLKKLVAPGAKRGVLEIRGFTFCPDEDIPGVWIGDGDGHAFFQADDGRVIEYANPAMLKDADDA